MWRDVAPDLARDHTVVLADLRGYGDSGKPAPDAANLVYSKRSMARDQVGLMRQLGFSQFQLAGHDRGGRVAHRLVLDHPGAVTRLAILDIVPTRHVFHNVTRDMATAYYHWFFLSTGYGIPEHLIDADPAFWIRSLIGPLLGQGRARLRRPGLQAGAGLAAVRPRRPRPGTAHRSFRARRGTGPGHRRPARLLRLAPRPSRATPHSGITRISCHIRRSSRPPHPGQVFGQRGPVPGAGLPPGPCRFSRGPRCPPGASPAPEARPRTPRRTAPVLHQAAYNRPSVTSGRSRERHPAHVMTVIGVSVQMPCRDRGRRREAPQQ
jgi:pimeloyl-ACP methyl ester carboxylesterase